MALESLCKHNTRTLQLLIILQFSIWLVTSKDNPSPVGHDCVPSDSNSYSENNEFQKNLNDAVFFHLVPNASSLAFSNTTMGEANDQVNALYYCRGDVSRDACHDCVKSAAAGILEVCNMSKQGIIWYEECTLRFSNRSISSLTEEDLTVWYPMYNYTPDLGDYLNQYQIIFDSTMKHLVNQAANNVSLRPKSFATERVNLSTVQSLRGIVQCAPVINGASCQRCLTAALAQMQVWTNTMEFLPSCFVGFELYGSRPLDSSPSPSTGLQVRYKVLLAFATTVLVLSLFGGFWYYWMRNPPKEDIVEDPSIVEDNEEPNENRKQTRLSQFTYSQVEEITNGFKQMLGEGGYAVVYHGCLSDSIIEVAVKVFSKTEAPKQFSTEIEVLGRISHKNLVSLIGYCEEGDNLALIYEFMASGDLKSLLSEHSDSLSWRRRVEIAIDTAQGLDYLHNGCSPPIVHRDVKPANILLNKDFRAKVADFGVSKIFPEEYVSNLLTRVVGTFGYLDPQYSLTGQLNEKGDVYSFGVVLLELITGKKAILNKDTNLGHWVRSMVERGDIASILDSTLSQDVDDDYVSVWKTVELAMRCVQLEAADRPTMTNIVMELKQCWSMMMSAQSTCSTDRTSATALSGVLLSPSPC